MTTCQLHLYSQHWEVGLPIGSPCKEVFWAKGCRMNGLGLGRQAEATVQGFEVEGRPTLLLPALCRVFLLAGPEFTFVREHRHLGMPAGIWGWRLS